jgi:hypothetical protein
LCGVVGQSEHACPGPTRVGRAQVTICLRAAVERRLRCYPTPQFADRGHPRLRHQGGDHR